VRPRDYEFVPLRVLLATVLIALVATGCRSHRADDDTKSGPEVIYQRAQKNMKNGDYVNAIKQLEGLQSRFPFSEPARQAQLDLIYVYYRSRQTEPAVDAADTFIRENPTNLRVDYAYYMKRGAYVGAINRAKYCIENYDGAPAVQPSMRVLVDAYRALHMTDLADNAERVYAANYPADASATADKPRKHWFW